MKMIPQYNVFTKIIEVPTYTCIIMHILGIVSFHLSVLKICSLIFQRYLITVSVLFFVGMSVRDVVTQFRHKIVLLFKLILLERRVSYSMCIDWIDRIQLKLD